MSDDVFFLDEAPWQILDRATAQRKLLLNAGYVPIPINGKAPPMPEWQKQRPSIGDISKWPELFPAAHNTGVLTRVTPTVDIDVYDAGAVEDLQNLLWEVIGDSGHTMVRVGQAPKCAIPFQTDQPFAKVSTPNFTSPDGRRHHVEVLSDGQQIVVFGKHPGTGTDYSWHGGEPGSVVRDACRADTRLARWSGSGGLAAGGNHADRRPSRSSVAGQSAAFCRTSSLPERPERPERGPAS